LKLGDGIKAKITFEISQLVKEDINIFIENN
jgi:hypothetical protein